MEIEEIKIRMKIEVKPSKKKASKILAQILKIKNSILYHKKIKCEQEKFMLKTFNCVLYKFAFFHMKLQLDHKQKLKRNELSLSWVS